MITIKSYTDLSQSKTLSKILPPDSADYCWGIDDKTLHYNSSPYPCAWKDYTCKEYYIPCWSLAALLSVFSYYEINNNGVNIQLSVKGEALITEKGEYLLDLAVNMIIHLHELNLL